MLRIQNFAILFLAFNVLITDTGLKAQQTAAKPVLDSLSIADMQYLRKMSSMVKSMEDSLGINENNMAQKVILVNPVSCPAIDTNIQPLKVPYADGLTTVLFTYAHQLFIATNSALYKKNCLRAKAGSLSRPAFADSISMLESKAITNTILIGLETGTTQDLPYPSNLINAVIDKVKRKINSATVLYMAYEHIRKQAKDANGISLYAGFQKFYDGLVSGK
ncbi:MAG: hypothetical protein V4722_23540 [Bacteroidota bacterium]